MLREDLDLEVLPLAPAEVHAEEHLGPILGFEPAGAGMDGQDRVAGIVLAAQHLPHLEVGDALVDLIGFGHAFRERVGVTLDGELVKDVGVVELDPLALPAVERRRQLRALALDLLSALVIVPKIGLPDLSVEIQQPRFGAGDVKDAPVASRDAAPDRSNGLSAHWG